MATKNTKSTEQEEVKTPEQIAMEEKSLEAQAKAEEKTLKQQLDAMPKKAIHIPEDPVNPDNVASVTWNGITYAIPRGQDFEVPYVIADIWRESYRKTQEVNLRIRQSTTKEIKVI
ncbi:hypothetical protein CPT_Pascal7 [Bacillus phage Pascal]|uniref:Uncharacterized protein n=1 Tax=Bacillus phage Pascal TaxID=1540092 RepID=A0A0A0RNP3_9CAUD|nr:hypothetical protein CPT_Pascal7 [Bacillus phage Pascal]AIW03642.1 hypothetical protein CPT_Pascal7 [Bacillus phage Pascal]